MAPPSGFCFSLEGCHTELGSYSQEVGWGTALRYKARAALSSGKSLGRPHSVSTTVTSPAYTGRSKCPTCSTSCGTGCGVPSAFAVGPALPGVECRIAPDGEVLLRGPNVLKEYYRDPAATREILSAEGWLHTGDIGEIDDDGFLRITDRKKDIIVTSGGKNVPPQAIESVLKADPLILQAMVIGDGQRHLMALVTLNQERVAEWAAREGIELVAATDAVSHPRINALIQESIRRANRELAAFEAVRRFRIVPREFTVEKGELTPTLKLRRHVIRERYRHLIEEMSRRP